ncbi:MAG TPA: 3-isopropylmalate dehydratase small subunit [Deltaproteobacteria bacterium]|nr:3-isopropylmalate dehydratase small subunit [Deltaproteobacteria bacterium]HPJ92734.1 3-isopropylmalate dehydratase small subunit [Deltaproteobacteria bacterium]HPR51707.1 3-isopropylmalate dehydratase small subunit [Deltaproteobacteria bacterium]
MIFKGQAFLFGDDIDTDAIIPARYLNTSDPEELKKHCMEDADPEFFSKISAGDIIVAGKNFGCGSSREHAPIAIKASGISCVIASSFARIFFRNSFNMGLPIFESDEASREIRQGDIVEVDASSGEIRNISTGKTYKAKPIPGFMQDLIEDGGLIKHIEKTGKI